MVQQLQNPLAEAEKIKGQAKLIEAEGKQELDAANMLADMKEFKESQAADMKKHNDNLALKLTELEQKAGKDLSQQTQENMLTFDPTIGDFV